MPKLGLLQSIKKQKAQMSARWGLDPAGLVDLEILQEGKKPCRVALNIQVDLADEIIAALRYYYKNAFALACPECESTKLDFKEGKPGCYSAGVPGEIDLWYCQVCRQDGGLSYSQLISVLKEKPDNVPLPDFLIEGEAGK